MESQLNTRQLHDKKSHRMCGHLVLMIRIEIIKWIASTGISILDNGFNTYYTKLPQISR